MKGKMSKLQAKAKELAQKALLNKKGAANMKYTEEVIMGVLILGIFTFIALFVIVTVGALSIFENISAVATIQTSITTFVTNAFSLLGVTGTFVGLAIFLAVIVVAFVYLRKMAGSSGAGGEYAG